MFQVCVLGWLCSNGTPKAMTLVQHELECSPPPLNGVQIVIP